MRPRFCQLFIAMLLITSLRCVFAADGDRLFDQAKRVVLPGAAATSVLRRQKSDSDWSVDEWEISVESLDQVEVALAAALKRAGIGPPSFNAHNFFRQYMPARWRGMRIIVVNGFYTSPGDLFPGSGIDPEKWKHELVTAFGGGCAFWYGVYVVEQHRFMPLNGDRGDRSMLICNAPK